jgi:NAD(P)-dependent dehydrogenase (short-subunit alcohol dehydrogenase family)
MDLKGAVAIVTGASGGIGSATVERLAAAGARLALAARDVARLDRVAREAAAAGAETIAIAADVTRADQVSGLVRATLARFRRIDALVNASGVFATSPIADLDEAEFDRQIAANLKSVFLTCKAVIPHLSARGSGHIVNVLSIAARQVFPENAAYCASKWGALGFTRVLAEEMRPRGVRVTAVLPGATDTPIWDGIAWAPPRAGMMRPEDVARAIEGALAAPPTANVEEIVLLPPGGIA